MRIAIGGFVHETNSFGSVPVTMELLEKCSYEEQVMEAAYKNSNSYVGGFLAAAKELDAEVVYTRISSMLPSGPCVKEGFELSLNRIVMLTKKAHEEKPLDGICLFMHGAGVAEGHPDVEGEILQALRDALGYEIPIAVAQDLHGNISKEMAELSDIMVGCKCYPHTDMFETGANTFRTLVKSIREGFRTYQHLIPLPWLMVPAQGMTTSGPAAKVRQLTEELEKDDVFHVSFFHGFPYADVPFAGASVITAARTKAAAEESAKTVARYVWEHLGDFAIELNSAEQAVQKALQAQGIALIHESSDNPGGGTPGDGTYLLRELLRVNVPSAFAYISDPEVAQQAVKAGVGAKLSCRLGGKRDHFHGEPVSLEDAKVIYADPQGEFVRKNPMGKGSVDRMGATACLQVGNVRIVVAEARFQGYDEGVFQAAGVDWTQMKILAIKSSQHFKGFWADKPVTIIPCDSPGLQSADLTQLPFAHVNKKYYPLGNPSFEV